MIAVHSHSLRSKLLRLMLLAGALALACVAGAVLIYEARNVRPRALVSLQTEAAVLDEVLSAALDFGLRADAEQGLVRHCRRSAIVQAALYDTQALFASYRRTQTAIEPPPAPRPPGHQFTARDLSLWHPVRNNDGAVIGHLYLVTDLPPLYARLPQYGIMVGAVLLALGVVGFVLMRGVQRHLFGPLASLVETTTHVTRHNDYARRAPAGQQDELGQLAQAFNQMLEVLGQRDAALRQASEQIHSVFDAATEVGIVAVDTHNVVTVFNTGAERMLGYAARDVIGKHSPTLWHDAEEIAERAAGLSAELGRTITGLGAFSALAQMGRHESREWTFVRRDGTRFTGLLVVMPVRNQAGAITGFLGVFNDISERKQADAAVRESEARFRTLFDAANDTILLFDGRVFLSVNRRGESMFGRSQAEIIGHSPIELSPPRQPDGHDSATRAQDYIQRALDGEPLFFEWQHCRRDGTPFDAEVSLNRMTLGGRIFLLAIVRDVTERKRADAELRRREERFRTLIEHASDMITVVSADGRIRFQSPSSERMLGYPTDELVGRSVFDFVAPDSLPAVRKSWTQVLENPGKVVSLEIPFRHRDGGWRLIEAVGRSIPEESPDGYVILNARDVTESRKLAEQFRQAQKMEAIGQLSGGVAHDFNNMLAVIQFNVSLLQMTPDLPADTSECIEDIGQAATRAANLTRQLLAFSRRQTLQPADLDLNDIVANLMRMLQRIVGEDIQLRVRYHAAPARIHADAGMMEQILLNLVVNARDALPRGGRLSIETSVVSFDESCAALLPQARPGHFVCLTVADNGCGMAPDILPRIFEPFFTTKEVGKGTGLGLATVYGITQQHGGWVSVYSEVGQGTTFRVYLPRHTEDSTSPARATPGEPAAGGHETILVVEDEPQLRALVRRVLSGRGYRILEAANGRAALRIWQEHQQQIDLLLTDLVMPEGLSGLELARQLQGEMPSLKVIYTSGYSAEIAGKDAPLQAGVNFLAKPFDAVELARAVRISLDAFRGISGP